MLPDRVSNPGPLTYESGALPIALHGLANMFFTKNQNNISINLCILKLYWFCSCIYTVSLRNKFA